jgi:hypothetical protein
MANNSKKSGPKAGDATGQQRAKLAAEQAQVAEERQAELTMVNQQQAIDVQEGVFDPSNGRKIADNDDEVEDAEILASTEVVDLGVETVESGDVVIRVNETLDAVTIGAGNHYSFKEGQKYKVPRNVAFHLEEKGYVWH